MTDLELNVELAKIEGYRWVQHRDGTGRWVFPHGGDASPSPASDPITGAFAVPNYSRDRNEIARLVTKLNEREQSAYIRALKRLVGQRRNEFTTSYLVIHLVEATARQRSESVLEAKQVAHEQSERHQRSLAHAA